MRQFCRQAQDGHAAKVNLIPFNPFPGTRFERSGETEIRAFQKKLLDAGILTMVRRTRGDDIDAACGQLAGRVNDRVRVRLGDKLSQAMGPRAVGNVAVGDVAMGDVA